eukprot:m.229369 g.229369  ORF g.229369 m.229369 type:complete len:210 (+) comp11897_c0_seq1:14-643(+)
MELPPSQTLYVNNINEKVPKDELRRSLYSLFSQFGAILDVVALKTTKLRGQAFIAFRDIGSATNAIRSMQGFVFYGKPLRLNYAKGKSHAVMKEDGSFAKLAAQKKLDHTKLRAGEAGSAEPVALPDGTSAVPYHMLFVSHLPEDATDATLAALFGRFPGFKEVRMVPQRTDVAFVEFGSADQATVALSGLHGFRVAPDRAIAVSYANK